MKTILMVMITAGLTGCATVDLTVDNGSLTKKQLHIAQHIATRTAQVCSTYTYNPTTGQPTSGYVRMANKPSVMAIHSSNSSWYKADLVYNSVWDSVYYDEHTGQIICGDKNWHTYLASKTTMFEQIRPAKR